MGGHSWPGIWVINSLLGGYFFKGRTFPGGPCAAGFLCVRGASEPSPTDSLTGFPCPPGFYCPVGTIIPKPCPKGTYRCIFSINVLNKLSTLKFVCLMNHIFFLHGSTQTFPMSENGATVSVGCVRIWFYFMILLCGKQKTHTPDPSPLSTG